MATPGYKTSEGILSGGALLAVIGCVQSLDGWQRVAALAIGGVVVCAYAISRAMVKRGGPIDAPLPIVDADQSGTP